MADYGDMFYGTLPEDTQDFRQVLAGIGRTIRDRAVAAGQRIGQSGQEAIALQNQIFGDPNRPLRVTDENALRRFTDMIMGGPLGFAPAGITAYHGSPYLFRMFNPAKVGTGEGAQAYGVGAGYTAEARPVAEEYMRQVTAGTPQSPVRTFKGQELTPQTPEYMAARLLDTDKMSLPQARKKVSSWISSAGPEMSQEVAKWQRTLDILNQAQKKSDFKNLGERSYLYKGDIPDEILPKFLDWDKPLNQQPNVMSALRSEAEQRVRSQKLIEIENDIRASRPTQNVGDDYLSMFSDANVAANQEIQKEAINKLNKMDLSSIIEKELETMKPKDMNWNMTGKELYEFLAKNQGSAQQASALLDRQGVRGIRYLDQGSRTGGSNTSNFVPFRPEDYKIQEINDIPLEEWIRKGLLD